jgi:hypothetical protein
MTIKEAKDNLIRLGLIVNGQPISFNAFKKIADVHEYGRGRNPLRIVFVGVKDNRFGFYPMRDSKLSNLKESYDLYVNLINSKSNDDEVDDDISWGNCGIPLSYGKLRSY